MATTAQTATLQEMEQADKYYGNNQDPTAYAAMVAEKISAIQSNAVNSKDSTFAKQYMELGRHFDMTHNANYYQVRNMDVLNFENDKLAQINTAISNQEFDTDVSRRQVEINNWYYQDKLETLFFLQIFFMSMLSMSILFYFQKSNLISSGFASVLTFVLLLIVGGIGLYRYVYTNSFRDSRWWYKRRFPKPIYTEKPKCGCVEDPFKPRKERLNCPAKTGNGPCVSSILEKNKPASYNQDSTINRISDQLELETVSYLETGKMNIPSSEDNNNNSTSSCPTSNNTPGSTNVALNKYVLPFI